MVSAHSQPIFLSENSILVASSLGLTFYNYRVNEWAKVSFDKLPDEKLQSEDVSGADRLR